MSDMTTLAVRISKEDKTQLMRCAIERDLSASQIIRQLIRNYIHHCLPITKGTANPERFFLHLSIIPLFYRLI